MYVYMYVLFLILCSHTEIKHVKRNDWDACVSVLNSTLSLFTEQCMYEVTVFGQGHNRHILW